MAWLTDVAEYLEDTIANYTVGTNIFIGYMPDTPDAAIAVYSAGGNKNPHGHVTPWEELRLEVRARAASYGAAETLMSSVVSALSFKLAATWNSSLAVKWCEAEAAPGLLEYDQKNRATFLGRFVLQAVRSDKYV